MADTLTPDGAKTAKGGASWIEGGSHRPLTLDDPARAYIVRRGHYDVFATEGGRRHHLFRSETGDLLCGVAPVGGFALVAVGSLDSAAEPVGLDAAADATGIERWVAGLSQAATEPSTDRPKRAVAPGSVTLADGER
ncbi:MAG: hypothetical protein FJX62_23705, partial [Alphaproteobacteria bacterium]|nr:hypothetical protein [Alphaproteobacteria bacterium]